VYFNYSLVEAENIKPLNGYKLASISLGCSKNRIDTEEILGYLSNLGLILTDDLSDADIIMVNTCSFIESAQKESIKTLLKLAQKNNERKPLIIAAGCLVETTGTKIINIIPEIDGAIGVHSYRYLEKFIKLLIAKKRIAIRRKAPNNYLTLSGRILTLPPHSVSVKIAEGCNNKCRYCLIPIIRGSYRSRDPEEIITEIKNLLSGGTREITLIAQDTTAYGSEKSGMPNLSNLITRILNLNDRFWLRIMYTYPSRIDDELVSLIANEPRICNYLDLPIQHVSNSILNNMSRHYKKEELISLLRKLRSYIPDLALRTTFMVGFPGEKHHDFNELLSFISEYQFEHIGAFTYSSQQGTAAYLLPDRVPKRVAGKRLDHLMLRQQQISHQLNNREIGNIKVILIDREICRQRKWYFGRTEKQAPEVDGGVFVYSKIPLEPGNWIQAKIVSAKSYNLFAYCLKLLDELPLTR
jgi:ribosomal protein S12 methylthiotransferase